MRRKLPPGSAQYDRSVSVVTAVVNRDGLRALGLAVAVPVLGALVALRPGVPFAVIGLTVIVLIASMPPAAHLLILIAITAIVPFATQNRYGIPITAFLPFSQNADVGGGTGSPGLILSDILLLAGLARAVPTVMRRRLPPRLAATALCIAAFLGVAGLQVIRSLLGGREPSKVGAEFRVLLDDKHRRRFLRGLPFVGLAVGLWGIAQRAFSLGVVGTGDAGLRQGVRFTTEGVGQIQGGLFAFPVAFVLAFAALVSGHVRSLWGRVLLLVVLIVNGISLLLTYERTFWIVTPLACLFVVAKASGSQRLRATAWGVAALAVSLGVLSTVAPRELTVARERFLSLGQYANDSSVRYRATESRHALAEITDHPLVGSGFAATIFWGRPWADVPPSSTTFIHNGYLWLAWRLGIPGALLLLAPLALAIAWRRAPEGEPVLAAVRDGSQAALLALLIASVTFPSFSQLSITPVMGVLLAVCMAPPSVPATVTRRQPLATVGAGPEPA